MPRPVKCRKVCHFPNVLEFLPADGTEKSTPIVLTVDEYETIRLLDKKGYSQEQCAASMQGEGIMRIAVTYENGQIFQHFGHTETFKIYDVEEGKVLHSEVVDTNGSGHGALAGVLNALNVDVLICGGIGGGAQTALAAAGIKLYGGVSGDADQAVEAFINETLDYNPDVRCSHHEHSHGEGHTCGEHGCGSHSCH